MKNEDQNSFAEGGELSQDLIDAMLNGGDLGGAEADLGEPAPEVDPWSDDVLQAEIEAARIAAGVSIETSPPPAMVPSVASAPAAAMAAAPVAIAPAPAAPPTAVHPVQFMPLTPDAPSIDNPHGIELLMDVALEVSVELGRSHMSIAEILALRTGSVIELDKLAGEPVDVSVNGTLVARGEVVVVDEKFGVRITEVVSKSRRLASLG
jgi:flagellar motor switch protein FliN/FliY